ncbi:hypothetical protein EPUS_05607 [Endocarpon pusillum Z07020]|uniref:N-acetylglucosaminylphosphatidylinositol deacetylase n=1 Tax=Endocarpon pusillum (strain Z07020 / HMAS-L-300199) TaxID=1263415 RepID=U1HN21_ENDPU|nr:uncharacterized protein EPUS_05607 [Endocarpon pusillum Z07020]ERF71735.1 hypothetical protein EPUS_05607 [Endocarpon pusillum Z07020]
MGLLYAIAIVLATFGIFWFMTTTLFASLFPPPFELRNKRILLLIGHPDDEAMFFAPALIALLSPENRNHIQIVCLSTGNAIGEGEIRRGELLNSARRLGMRSKDDVLIIDDARFQDGAQNHWKKEDIADLLSHLFTPQPSSKLDTSTSSFSTLNQPPQTQVNGNPSSGPINPADKQRTPEVILTFDPHGISTHPNHCACYYGAIHFLQNQLKHPKPNSKSPTTPPTLYTLTSISRPRKYISVLDAPITLLTSLTSVFFSNLQQSARKARRNVQDGRADRVIFVSGFRNYVKAFGAMVFAHKTQMLWFRWGWVLVGRYMVVNDLKRERVGV